MKIRFEFKLEDFWIGVYWRRTPTLRYDHQIDAERLTGYQNDVWVCFVPCFPLHLTCGRIARKNPHSAGKQG